MRSSMRGWWLAAGWLLFHLAAPAASRQPENLDASMAIHGTLDIGADGTVASVTFQRDDLIEPVALEYATKQARAWRFQPILADGVPVALQVTMAMRLILQKRGQEYSLGVRGVVFGDPDHQAIPMAASLAMPPPKYPRSVFMEGGSGTVFLALRIGRDGSVKDVAVEQVNLYVRSSEKQMAAWRKAFADASAETARSWKYEPKDAGRYADGPDWTIRTMASFMLDDHKNLLKYGKWHLYLPGEQQPIGWAVPQDPPGFTCDTVQIPYVPSVRDADPEPRFYPLAPSRVRLLGISSPLLPEAAEGGSP